MPVNLSHKLPALLAFGFILFLIATVTIANRGEGAKWWPFLNQIPFGDKLGHVGLFGTLGFLCNLTFSSPRSKRHVGFATTTTIVLLAIISLEEISQAFIPSRSFDLLDWSADLIGLASGQGFAFLVFKARPVEENTDSHP